eukprot:scaffold20328_cov116-Isochrysis_galbana.AAC.9
MACTDALRCFGVSLNGPPTFFSGLPPRVLRVRLGACVRREEGWGFRTLRRKVTYGDLGLAQLFPLAVGRA